MDLRHSSSLLSAAKKIKDVLFWKKGKLSERQNIHGRDGFILTECECRASTQMPGFRLYSITKKRSRYSGPYSKYEKSRHFDGF